MQLGIKVGPVNWRAKLCAGRAIAHVEVYYDLRRGDEYLPLYAWLRAHGVRAGLHASTALDDGLMPNLATADDGVRRASAALFARIVDVAAAEGMAYVVIHPGSTRNWGIRGGRTFRQDRATPAREANRRAIDEVLALAAYARARDLELLPENLPAYDFAAYDPEDRTEVIDVGFLP
ncbi:MAG: TIM barrel protein [Anaerolineae bacterium]|nr:TIM barrel protein [Anaerolineae bacterium]